MKNTYLLLMCLCISKGLSAQYCYTGPNTIIPPSYSNPGFLPTSDSLPCVISGAAVNDTIYFTIDSNFSGFTVTSFTFDSIGNLPTGLCWNMNKANNTMALGETVALLIEGSTTAPAGQYKLKIFVHYIAGAITLPPYTDWEIVVNRRYYLRVACSNAGCSSIDTVNGKTNFFISDTFVINKP